MRIRKPEGKRLFGTTRHKWKAIKMDLERGVGVWSGFIWFRIDFSGGLL
jgi:hypothetical protein